MDRVKIEEFLDTFSGFVAGTTTVALLAVADRTGLAGYLLHEPSGTSDEIAEGAGLNPRYVREILSGLAAAGILDYEPSAGVFTLPPEHALFIGDQTSPYFMGGWLDMLPAVMSQVEGVARATVHGGGVGFEEFGESIIRGIDRGNGPSYRVFLTQRWLPSVPGLVERLEQGVRVADIGCGSGTAAILMAEAFPRSQIVGYDLSADSLSLARRRSIHLDNVEFHEHSAEDIPVQPGFDFITTFDVIHDLIDPPAALSRIRSALRPGGVYLMMEPNASSRLEDNLTSRGAMLYGISTMHCMTQSLARDGAGLGAAWGRQRAEEMAVEAGFSSFEPLDRITNKFSAFFLLQA